MVLESLTAGDRAQLHELYSRSVVLLELARCRDWVALFDPQAIVRCGLGEAGRPVAHEFNGRAELSRLAERMARGEFDIAIGELVSPSRLRHFVGNICLFQDGRHYVSGFAHVAVMSVGAGEPRWIASGTYADRLHKGNAGCWLFQSRTFTADAAAAGQFSQAPAAGLARIAAHS